MYLKSWRAGNKYIKLFLLLTLRYENSTTSEKKKMIKEMKGGLEIPVMESGSLHLEKGKRNWGALNKRYKKGLTTIFRCDNIFLSMEKN